MRAAHIGQALDIAGHWEVLDEAVTAGDPTLVETRVLAAHRLKTAAFARSLATIGSILADAPAPLEEGLRDFFGALGLAYQIVDDVLDLRPPDTAKNRKAVGDDLRAGKVTLPVAKAVALLPGADRVALRDQLGSLPHQPDRIRDCITVIEECGALDSCLTDARSMIDTSWARLDPTLPASHSKAMIHAFAWFTVYRTTLHDSPWIDRVRSPAFEPITSGAPFPA
ncbi:MAG: polyprenyl synthetase family protein [Actinomycetota bacterium]